MNSNFKYRKAFLITAYAALIQLCMLTVYEIPSLAEGRFHSYFISKSLIALILLSFIVCIHKIRLIKYWTAIFYLSCSSLILVGEFFHPGYHLALIQFMFICVIVFEGFPFIASLVMILFLIEKACIGSPLDINMAYAILSSWVLGLCLSRYVSSIQIKHNGLDRKLRYKGIKTSLFMHDLKNQFQPLVFSYPDSEELSGIITSVQNFNSLNKDDEIQFREAVENVKEKFQIQGEFLVEGDDDFFIDQLDLQTILSNLMKNSQVAANEKGISLVATLKNSYSGFSYEDNAGGMTPEQYEFFNQKDFKIYNGAEKKGYGLLLIKKLVQHHGGKFVIKRIPNGMKFEIKY